MSKRTDPDKKAEIKARKARIKASIIPAEQLANRCQIAGCMCKGETVRDGLRLCEYHARHDARDIPISELAHPSAISKRTMASLVMASIFATTLPTRRPGR